MAYKTVCTVVTDLAAEGTALEAAARMARLADGHLEIICLGLDRTQPGFYYAGANAVAYQMSLAEAEKDARRVDEDVRKHLSTYDMNWSTHPMAAQSNGLAGFLAHLLRFADLVVLPRPYGANRSHEHEAIVESALFDAQVPVLIMPDGDSVPDRFARVVVAWNESPEALNAVRRALPLLIAADSVNVAIIDPPAHSPDRSDPGGALSQMLVRHGVSTEVSVLAKTLSRVSDVIVRHATDRNADLVVMGAYGHSRFRESILGGATRNILQTTEMPVFMAH